MYQVRLDQSALGAGQDPVDALRVELSVCRGDGGIRVHDPGAFLEEAHLLRLVDSKRILDAWRGIGTHPGRLGGEPDTAACLPRSGCGDSDSPLHRSRDRLPVEAGRGREAPAAVDDRSHADSLARGIDGILQAHPAKGHALDGPVLHAGVAILDSGGGQLRNCERGQFPHTIRRSFRVGATVTSASPGR